jgi:hypothetical protein
MKKRVMDWGTLIELTDKEPEDICKLGQGVKCCAFLVVSASGFECIRMDHPTNNIIFKRLKAGTMVARGEGRWPGCPWEREIQT